MLSLHWTTNVIRRSRVWSLWRRGRKHSREAVINSPAIGGSLGPRSSMGNARHSQAHDKRASHGEEPGASCSAPAEPGRVIVTATKRTTLELHNIEFFDSSRYSATKEAVRFEVRKVIAVQGRNPLLLSASTARAWRHTRARVDRVAAPTYPDPATTAWLLESIASWRSQRSLQHRRRWHRSPATAHRTSREAADTPWPWFEAHKQQEQPDVTERSAWPSLVQETARQSSMRE